MSIQAIIVMVLSLGIIWGGLIYYLIKLIRLQSSEE
ncbi:MAG: methionine/alanine import family NSS transporter small subunit [Lachnospiraceae bacterium]|nr:methionine/alanine import family NSS transporter small subunit [Lachnospiraceae bacterium]